MITLEDINKTKARYAIGFKVKTPSDFLFQEEIYEYNIDLMAKRIARLERGLAELSNAMNEESFMLDSHYHANNGKLSVEYTQHLLRGYGTKIDEILDTH